MYAPTVAMATAEYTPSAIWPVMQSTVALIKDKSAKMNLRDFTVKAL